MLHVKTIEPETLSVLKRLQHLPVLSKYCLVGGTALALKYGHRLSVDIDLFGDDFDKASIFAACEEEFGADFIYEETKNGWALFCFINNIKADIVHYKYPLIAPVEQVENIRIASMPDIAAMKINAVLGRASKKDFWDIFELLNHYSLEQIIGFHVKKYPKQMLLISIPQALSYFEEAEEGEDPVSLKGQTWQDVKQRIKDSVGNYLK